MTDEEWKPEDLPLLDQLKSFSRTRLCDEDEWWAHVFLAGYVWPRLTVKGKVEKPQSPASVFARRKKERRRRARALIRVLEQSNLPSFLCTDLAPFFLTRR